MNKPVYKLKQKQEQRQAQAYKNAEHIMIEGIPIELTYKKVTKGRLSVDDRGDVRLTLPYRVEQKRLEEFVNSKIEWLRRHLEKAQMSKPLERKFINGEFVYLLGHKYDCFIFESKNSGITKENDAIHMRFKSGLSNEKKLKLLRDWYKDALHNIISERLRFWEEKTGLKCSVWRIRHMKSCWGSCNPQTSALLFNLSLIKKPLICIDYIIVHELGHMVSRLHDKTFKNFLDIYLPHWRQIRRDLNLKHSDFVD